MPGGGPGKSTAAPGVPAVPGMNAGGMGVGADGQQMMTADEMAEYHAYAQQYAAAIELQQRHYAQLNSISGASTIAAANMGFQNEKKTFNPGRPLTEAEVANSTADVRDLYENDRGDIGNKQIAGHDPYKRFSGILNNFKDDRGFGWIQSKEACKIYGKDVFVHRGDIAKDLDKRKQRTHVRMKDGDTITFYVGLDKGFPMAKDCEIIPADPDEGKKKRRRSPSPE